MHPQADRVMPCSHSHQCVKSSSPERYIGQLHGHMHVPHGNGEDRRFGTYALLSLGTTEHDGTSRLPFDVRITEPVWPAKW